MNVCIDCRWCKTEGTFLSMAQGQAQGAECTNPEAVTRDMVTGRCECYAERHSGARNACGKAGRLWQAKPKT